MKRVRKLQHSNTPSKFKTNDWVNVKGEIRQVVAQSYTKDGWVYFLIYNGSLVQITDQEALLVEPPETTEQGKKFAERESKLAERERDLTIKGSEYERMRLSLRQVAHKFLNIANGG